MNPKLLIVIVVVLVLAFVGAFFVGGDQGGPTKVLPPTWVRGLAERLLKPSTLTVEDIDLAVPQDCLDQLRAGRLQIPAGQACTYVVAASDAPVRTLSVRLVLGQQARVTYSPRNEDRLTAREDLDGDHSTTTVRVFDQGGVIEIVCRDVDQDCQLAIGED